MEKWIMVKINRYLIYQYEQKQYEVLQTLKDRLFPIPQLFLKKKCYTDDEVTLIKCHWVRVVTHPQIQEQILCHVTASDATAVTAMDTKMKGLQITTCPCTHKCKKLFQERLILKDCIALIVCENRTWNLTVDGFLPYY